ncbi:hypothetical protein RM652_02505 [Mammaliicoccus sciuri]|uniref:hypothetical protein n=1 Tax=Mammaliicoccus sciuri TaxID=1296 RepID=UPI0028881961|nr:hypothetical protein [Mammaliicoccus sciuri]MDT0701973.1 hypothetical protein [Mammaliicoccus sciuri]
MKKVLVLLFASLLVLGACGQKEESSSKDDTKETKEVKKEAKKEDKKESKDKEVSKKTEDKSDEQSTEEVATNEQQTTQENTSTEEVTQEQSPTKDEMAQKFKNGENINGQIDNEGNEYVQAQGNGDAMGYYKTDGSYCTVGGCLTPEEMDKQEELNYQAMEEEGVSREEYDGIKAKEAELTRQRDAGEITSEEYTEAIWDLH